MSQTVTVPASHLDRIERRIESLETVLKRFLSIVETRSPAQNDVFSQLYTSKEFTNHLKDTLTLFRKDRNQFVDPFVTYREQ